MALKKYITVAAGVFVLASFSFAADWSNWRGSDYDGISKETGLEVGALASPEIVWQGKVGMGYSSVTVANGKAYTMANENEDNDVVYCFDAVTGKSLWRHTYAEALDPKWYDGGCSATPTIDNGRVYTVSKSGHVFCLDADSGKVIWEKKLSFKVPTWGFAGSALILGEKAIFNIGSAGLALNKADGSVIWQSEDSECGYATPVPYEAGGKTLICIFGKDSVMSVDPADGSKQWEYGWKTGYDVNAADPIIVNYEVFITSGYGHGCALLKIKDNKPELVWESKKMRSQMSGPVLIGGYLYGFDDNKLACMEWKTGEVKWTEKAPGKGSLSAVGDKLIVISERGKLSIVDASPSGFKEFSSAQVLKEICWAMPTYVNGYIYVHDAKKGKMNDLICIKAGK